MNSKRINKWMMLATAGIVLLSASCKKEKPVLELPPIPTKWERIAGTYKVYDTTGVYLYEMDISHKTGMANQWGVKEDSLVFTNFDGEFKFTTKQVVEFSNIPMYIRIGQHDTLYDAQSNRWKLGAGISEVYNNFKNDTILLKFSKTNINYYLHDLTPYYACDCKQIAVKQH